MLFLKKREKISPKEKLTNDMVEFMISHIEEKFKDKLIQKVFFEFGNYYSSEHNNEPYCDFRAVVASKDEVDRVVEKYVQQGETREEAVSISDSSGEYDTHDWHNHVFFEFPEAKYGIEWGDMVECAEEAAQKIKMHDFSFPKTPDFYFGTLTLVARVCAKERVLCQFVRGLEYPRGGNRDRGFPERLLREKPGQ